MSLIMLLQLLTLYASFLFMYLFIYLLSLVQFVRNLRDKRLKILVPGKKRGRGGGVLKNLLFI